MQFKITEFLLSWWGLSFLNVLFFELITVLWLMCSPRCSKCPEAFMEGDMIVLTDDNEVAISGVRKIKLTKRQFKDFLEDGKKLMA